MADVLPTGSRIQDFAQDTPVTDTFLDQFQDEMINATKARRWNATGLLMPDSAGSWDFAYTGTGDYEYYFATAVSPNAEQMGGKIILPVDSRIIDIDMIYKGSDRTGGEMALYSQQLISVGNASARNSASKLYDLGDNGTNPWQPSSNPTYIHRVRTTVNTTIAENYEYFISIISSTTGAGSAEAFFTILINAQFSTG